MAGNTAMNDCHVARGISLDCRARTNSNSQTCKIYIHNCPLKGIGVRDNIIISGDFSFFFDPGSFSIGCGSKFRAEVAYLEVGSSDFEQIHEKNYSMKCRIYS